MNPDLTIESKSIRKINYKIEISAGISTFLTLSYIFLLNPLLLSKTGMDISAAFFATVVSAAIATLGMGIWAKLPFAVAPAPSITTFFVSFVCLKMGISWEGALMAVIFSGVLSIIMTRLSIRAKLIDSISTALSVGVLVAIGGFLVANGLVQGKIISYSAGYIEFSKLSPGVLYSPGALVLYTGLLTTLVFRLRFFRFSGAPILGIIAASIVAVSLGIKAGTKAHLSTDMFGAIGDFDFSVFSNVNFILAMLVFFIIDFFGGVGKYIGLFAAMGNDGKRLEKKGMGNALYIDGIGNIIGGFLGASSLAVFVSSAVGISSGGRTGWTAITCACLMLLSLFVIPLVGAIPVEATSGILVYVGLLLTPFKELKLKNGFLNRFDIIVAIVAGLVSFITYGIDKAILVVFLVYTAKIIFKKGKVSSDYILIGTTSLLLAAVVIQYFMQ